MHLLHLELLSTGSCLPAPQLALPQCVYQLLLAPVVFDGLFWLAPDYVSITFYNEVVGWYAFVEMRSI